MPRGQGFENPSFSVGAENPQLVQDDGTRELHLECIHAQVQTFSIHNKHTSCHDCHGERTYIFKILPFLEQDSAPEVPLFQY